MFLQKADSTMNFVACRTVVVFQKADVAIYFENGEGDVGDGGDAVLAKAFLNVIHGNVFAAHGSLNDNAIVNENSGVAFEKLANLSVAASEFGDPIVEDEKGDGSGGASEQGGIRSGHGVLDGVAEKQEKGQVEGRHLPHFPFTAQAHADEYDAVHGERAQSDLQQDRKAWKNDWVHCGADAVTGVGAPFGVLR